MRISQTSCKALVALLATTANAHSWIEQLMVIASNGTFVGSPGYPRGNVLRTSPDFSDTAMVHMLPENGNKVQDSDTMCRDSQSTKNQTAGSPRLQAQAGSRIALRYQENGHVTLPENQKGKPDNRGTIYVYGTTTPKDNDKFLDIHKVWNKDGTGGDKRGVLLSTQNFDDSRCYQINNGEISKNRQQKFPHQADQTMGQDMWCQQDMALPSNAPSGKPYTLYWVWDWPTLPGKDPSLPNGKPELYTTCMDVDITSGGQNKMSVQASYDKDQSLNSAAIPEQFSEIFGSGSGGGGSQAGAADSGASSSAAAAPPSSAPVPSASASPAGLLSSSVNMFAGRVAGATSSAAQNVQSRGPSFVTRTRTVTATPTS